jgi:hypothetical protein
MKKNKYAELAKRKELLGLGTTAATAEEKSGKGSKSKIDYGKALKNTARDMVIGGLGGSLIGNVILGRYAFITGLIVTGLGHAYDSPTASGFGIGLMASGGFKGGNGLSGTDGVEGFNGLNGVKDRFSRYTDNFKKQLFIDKLPTGKKKVESTESQESGVNGTTYYETSPGQFLGKGEVDYSAVEKLEQQLENSAREFSKANSVNGNDQELDGTAIEDRLF